MLCSFYATHLIIYTLHDDDQIGDTFQVSYSHKNVKRSCCLSWHKHKVVVEILIKQEGSLENSCDNHQNYYYVKNSHWAIFVSILFVKVHPNIVKNYKKHTCENNQCEGLYRIRFWVWRLSLNFAVCISCIWGYVAVMSHLYFSIIYALLNSLPHIYYLL